MSSDSSSEFGLPRGDTHSEANSHQGDSTIDFLLPTKVEQSPGSTIFNEQHPRSVGPASLANASRLGDFRIECKVGEGAMGEVYQATQISLDRLVALKVLPTEFRRNATLVERFTREARSLAGLDHPHIVRIFATGEADSRLYVALEFIDGCTLQEWIDRLKRLSVSDAIHATLVCAWALHHAHERGIVHRDVKPSNVLVTLDGRCKVADFGLVKMVEKDLGTTTSGTSLGTPDYMSPEQSINARVASPRSDLYSLGVMLYVMLTGELPFKGESYLDCVTLKQAGRFKPAKSLVEAVPDRLDLIIGKALAPLPEHRYANCLEFIRDLALLQRHNDSLSFAPDSKPYVAYGPWVSMIAEANAKAATTVEKAKPKSPPPELSGPIIDDEKKWYVHHKNKLGKSVITKMMTGELILALEKKLLPLQAKLKASPKDPFTSLVEHSEFHPVLIRLGVKVPRKALAASAPVVVPSGNAATPASSGKKRRRRRNEKLDLLMKLGIGLSASYGLIRGIYDLVMTLRH